MASSKIGNGLFVWGNSNTTATDLAVLPKDQFNQGFKGGDAVYAEIVNSVLRNSSLFGYSLINALSEGPNTNYSTISDLSGNWDDVLTSYDFNYDINDSDASTFRDRLKEVIDAYIRRSECARSINANCWTTPRNFQIIDSTDENVGTSISIRGDDQNYTGNVYYLHLPSDVKFEDITATGSVTTPDVSTTRLNNRSINSIFLPSNSTKVREAQYAEMIGNKTDGGSNVGSASVPVYLSAGNITPCTTKAVQFENSTSLFYVYKGNLGTTSSTVIENYASYALDSNLKVDMLHGHGILNTNSHSGQGTISFSILQSTSGTFKLNAGYAYKVILSEILPDGYSFYAFQGSVNVNRLRFSSYEQEKIWIHCVGGEIYICSYGSSDGVYSLDIILNGTLEESV